MDHQSKLTEMRSLFGLTQNEIAAMLGKTQAWVSKYEGGKIPSIKLSLAQKIDETYSLVRKNHMRKLKRRG